MKVSDITKYCVALCLFTYGLKTWKEFIVHVELNCLFFFNIFFSENSFGAVIDQLDLKPHCRAKVKKCEMI